MTSRERILNALRCEPVDRPPVWFMRQAGRYLPEYRGLKKRHDFLELVRTPELAATVTLQPLRRFPLDAAIIFSDILVIPEALGQPYHFREEGGIGMNFTVRTAEDVARLDPAGTREKLAYLGGAIRETRGRLGADTALLGFGGSPWTLAAYMIQGQGSQSWEHPKALFYNDRDTFDNLLEKVTRACIDSFRMQIDAGVDALQIFDSCAAACPAPDYADMSLRWIRRIIAAVGDAVPVILFARGVSGRVDALADTGASGLSLDWTADLPAIARQRPRRIALQGNLDPILLTLEPSVIASATAALLDSMSGWDGYIVNLGHGVTPQARLDSVETFIQTVVSFSS